MWKRASLKFRMVTAFVGTSVFLVAIATLSYFTLKSVASEYQKLGDESLPTITHLADMRAAAYTAARSIVVLSGQWITDDIRKKYEDTLAERIKAFETANEAYRVFPYAEGEAELHGHTITSWTKLKSALETALPLTRESDPGSQAKVQVLLYGDMEEAITAFASDMEKLIDLQREQSKAYVANAQSTYQQGNIFTVIVAIVGSALSLLFGIFFAASIAKRFSELSAKLAQESVEVSSASRQISSASEQLSSAAAQQAASLQETSASIEEITAMVANNTENANQSRSVSEGSRAAAETGRQAVDEMIEAIQAISQSNSEISNQIQTSNSEIADIVKVINEIGNKTKVINDIVFQTKLLSFNASVEAARAGEHGKGFAVVAEEVGSLAQMSGNAAKEISEMLENSIERVEATVRRSQTELDRLMTSGREKVEVGQSVAKRCGDVLEDVVSQVSRVSQMSIEIATASNEQTSGIREISKAMAQLDSVTQQNAAAAHQTAASAVKLTGQAHNLNTIVSDLSTFIYGSNHDYKVQHDDHTHGGGSQPSQKTKQVVQFKKNTPSSASREEHSVALKEASGSGLVPDETDPRFQDI